MADTDDNRPFPIQQGYKREADGTFSRPVVNYAACTIPWWLAEEAYRHYAAKFGNDQSLERLAERGGFGREELIGLLRQESI